jgi:hypothetical protein
LEGGGAESRAGGIDRTQRVGQENVIILYHIVIIGFSVKRSFAEV